MQRARRANPYPFTWEIPVAAVVAVVLVMVLAVHAGRTLANFAAGAGIAFSARGSLFTSLVPILRGDAAAGLGPIAHPASATALWVCIVVVELVVWVAIGFALKAGLDRWGPGRIQGMATRAEAERLLGRARLRKVAAVVRPDLFGTVRAR